MSILSDFTNLLKTLSADRKMLKIFFAIICILIVLGYFVTPLLTKKKVDSSVQCEYLIEQNRQLVNSLLEVRKGLSEMATQPTSYVESGGGIIFAQQRQQQQQQQILTKNQMQQRIRVMMRKVDSVLMQRRIDSIKRSNPKQFKII